MWTEAVHCRRRRRHRCWSCPGGRLPLLLNCQCCRAHFFSFCSLFFCSFLFNFFPNVIMFFYICTLNAHFAVYLLFIYFYIFFPLPFLSSAHLFPPHISTIQVVLYFTCYIILWDNGGAGRYIEVSKRWIASEMTENYRTRLPLCRPRATPTPRAATHIWKRRRELEQKKCGLLFLFPAFRSERGETWQMASDCGGCCNRCAAARARVTDQLRSLVPVA